MNTTPMYPTDEMFEESRPAAYAFLEAACALVKRVEAGEISEQQAKEGIMELLKDNGTDIERRAEHFLLHTLHQPRLEAYRRRTGIIID